MHDIENSFHEQVYRFSLDEPTERILLRIGVALEVAHVHERVQEEVDAYLKILRERTQALREATINLTAVL